MDKSIFTRHRSVLGKARWLTGAGFLAVLAIAVVLSIGSAQAAEVEQQQTLHSDDGGRILLAANDAHAADAAKKASAASALANAAEKPHGIAGWLLAYLAKNPFAYLFLALALGYPLGRLTVGGLCLGTTAGSLVVGVAIALTSSAVFGITYAIPGLV
jgi:hypothetical protein